MHIEDIDIVNTNNLDFARSPKDVINDFLKDKNQSKNIYTGICADCDETF